MIVLTMDDIIGIAVWTVCSLVLFFVWVVTTTIKRKRKEDDHAAD